MSYNLSLIGGSARNDSTKDLILSVLIDKYSSSPSKMYNILKKKFAYEKGYQSVYKAFLELNQSNIIIKENNEFKISLEWIKNIKKFAENVESTHLNFLEDQTIKDSEKFQHINFNSLKKAENFFYLQREEFFNNIKNIPKKDRIICAHGQHCYVALMDSKKEYDFVTRLKKNSIKCYILNQGNTLLDNWIQSFYHSIENSPVKVKNNAQCSILSELWIYPDKMIEVFFTPQFSNYYNKIYTEYNALEGINFADIIKKMHLLEKNEVKIIMTKDKKIIQNARNTTINQF